MAVCYRAETFNNLEAKMQSEEQLASDSDPTTSNSRRDWPPSFLRLVLGAVFAAGLSYIVLRTMYPFFVLPPEIASVVLEFAPFSAQLDLEKAEFVVDGKNFSVFFAIIGGILGVSCVLFSFGTRSVTAIVVAVVCAAAMGCVGANLSNWMFTNLRQTSGKDLVIMGVTLDNMGQTIVGYASVWGLIGLGVGLGVGSARGIGKSLVGGIAGLCGGALAAMTYVVLTAQFSIGTTMNRVLPIDNTRLAIWLVLFHVMIAGCIALGLGERRRKGAA